MSIFAYVGLPGSGKSYTVVEQQVLPALRDGRIVVTNLPLKRDLICQDLRIPESQLREFPTEAVMVQPELILEAAPPGAVLILDEVWKLFPAGQKTNQVPDAFKTAFAEHRHRVNDKHESTQIVLVTQDLAQISPFARQLVEQTFRTTKLTAIGVRSRFRTDVYAGPVQGPSPNPSAALRQIFGRYQEKVWRYYSSHTQSLSKVDGADERPVDGRGNVLLRPVILMAPVLILGLLWFGISHLVHRRAELEGRDGHGGVVGAVGAALSGRPQGFVGARDAAVPLATWHVTAVIDGKAPVGGVAWLNRGDRVALVDLHLCVRSLFAVRCPYRGSWYDESGETEGETVPGLELPTRMLGVVASPVGKRAVQPSRPSAVVGGSRVTAGVRSGPIRRGAAVAMVVEPGSGE